jgi:hypothetical protein
MKSKRREAMLNARFGFSTCWTSAAALLLVALVAGAAQAQVPQDMTFRGRLVDGAGTPETGPVDLELRVFDAETLGTELYAESHMGVSLDATGAFALQLGLGAPLSGTFDAALFSEVDRWLEVVAAGQVLTPRQIIGSVPWALIAQQANEIVPDPNASRFEDCGDGTLADHDTGLQWEMKTGTPGSSVTCGTVGCPDPHDVNNRYWTSFGGSLDGDATLGFLARLNGEFDPLNPTGCFADHCDWKQPSISELQAIMIGPDAAPGQDPQCLAAPCVDPAFAAIAGPLGQVSWSRSLVGGNPNSGWVAFLANGTVTTTAIGGTVLSVHAVRTGSCD